MAFCGRWINQRLVFVRTSFARAVTPSGIFWHHASGEAMISEMVSTFSACRRLRVPESPLTSGAIRS
jgi:hypothetical protein